MDQFCSKFLRHYWLVLFVVAMGLLSAYTSSPIYGAPAATPTPDVQTVPKPVIIDTPTNTPFPTPTPSSNIDSPGGGGPVATRSPDDQQENNDDDNDDADQPENNQGNQPPTNGQPTPTNAAPATNPTANNGTPDSSTADGLTGAVTAVTLNMRKGPSTKDHIVDTLFMNDQVTVSGRDSSGAWWYVCCGAGFQRSGWVSAQFITPHFADSAASTLLPVLSTSPAAVATKNESAPAATGTPGATSAAQQTAPSALLLTMRAEPAFAWQGQQFQLQLVLRNSGAQALTALHFQNDLPPALALIETTVSDGGAYRYTGAAEQGPLLVIDWPTLPAGAQVMATLTLQVRADTAPGALIDNLAAVTSAEGMEALAGLTLAMPPTGLPQFR